MSYALEKTIRVERERSSNRIVQSDESAVVKSSSQTLAKRQTERSKSERYKSDLVMGGKGGTSRTTYQRQDGADEQLSMRVEPLMEIK